jgi:hypothetical protein
MVKLKKQNYFLILLSFFVIVSSLFIIDNPDSFKFSDQDNQATPTQVPNQDVVTNIAPNSTIQSPFKLTGQINSSWQFECTFMVEVVDYDHKISYSYPVSINSSQDCNSSGMKQFSVNLDFDFKNTKGAVVVHADNPSGLPENSKTFTIPVTFN